MGTSCSNPEAQHRDKVKELILLSQNSLNEENIEELIMLTQC